MSAGEIEQESAQRSAHGSMSYATDAFRDAAPVVTPPAAPPPRVPRWTRWLVWAMATTVAIFATDVLFHPLPDAVSDGLARFGSSWVVFGAAALCVAKARASSGERGEWLLVALAMALWGIGELYFASVLWDNVDVPYPSPADAFWLGFYVPAYVALYRLLRKRAGPAGDGVWLDAVVAALGVGGAGAAVAFGVVVTYPAGTTAEVVTNLAYPVADLGLVALVAAAVTVLGWRAAGAWRWIGPAFALFAVADTTYLIEVARGSYTTGGVVDLLWPAAALLVGVGAWRPEARVAAPARAAPGARVGMVFAVPAACGLGALVLLVADHYARTNQLALTLATASIVVILIRLYLTLQDNTGMLARSRDEAATDALTGLGNRRRLASDLALQIADLDPERPLMLTLFDLDGFKQYNDTFGHLAGDELLERLGGRLAETLAGRGTAYRMGGDEFCALWSQADADQASVTTMEAVEALSERGEGFSIGCSYGSVLLPNETTDPSDALRTADRRMYLRKGRGRVSAGRQSSDVLLSALAERDSELSVHLGGVADLVFATATRLGVAPEDMEAARQTALLHDVGKVAIPDEILSKPGPLDSAEWQFMKRHTIIGERIISAAPALARVARYVRSTHERFDGAGYPDGLAGEDIPLIARIVAVCDTYDAMITKRSYREAGDAGTALAELRRCAGTQFDPAVVEAFGAALASTDEEMSTEQPTVRPPLPPLADPVEEWTALTGTSMPPFLSDVSAAGMLDQIAEAVSVIAPNGAAVHTNAAGTAILDDMRARYEERAAAGLPWGALAADGTDLPIERLPVVITRMTGQACSDVEVGVRNAAGDVRWLRTSTRRMSDGTPPYAVIASYTDVTGQRLVAGELEQVRARNHTVVEALHEGVVLADTDGVILSANQRAAEVLGVPVEQLIGAASNDSRWRAERPDGTQISGEDHPITLVCETGEPQLEYVVGIHVGDEPLRWLNVHAMPMHDSEGALSGVVATFEDISSQIAERDALRLATELFSTAFAEAPIGMALTGPDAGWLQVNDRLCQMVGYSEAELLALTFEDITHPDDLGADLALHEETIAGKRAGYQMHKRYVRKDGAIIWVLLSVSLVRDDDGVPLHLIAHIQDVTEQRALEAKLQERADRDELTGLVNRRRFGEELSRQLARTARHAEPAALAMIDLDGFKAVNDKLGHAAGDEVLRAVATALADRVRETDMVARLGGDEFAALLVGVGEAQLSDMAGLLRKTAAEASRGSGVTASVGITTLVASDDVDEALARADRAMYAAKSDSGVHGLGPGEAGIVAPSGR